MKIKDYVKFSMEEDEGGEFYRLTGRLDISVHKLLTRTEIVCAELSSADVIKYEKQVCIRQITDALYGDIGHRLYTIRAHLKRRPVDELARISALVEEILGIIKEKTDVSEHNS